MPADELSVRTWWEKIIARLPYFYISLILWVIAAVLFGLPWFGQIPVWVPWLDNALHPIAESFLVAGILVLIVDPFLKERLLKEASKGIFHYLLGFDQQVEIKERLRTLVFGTTLFRKNYRMKCSFIPQSSGLMRLEIQSSFEVINPANEENPFDHVLQGEKVEKLEVHSMTLISEERNYNLVPTLEAKSDDSEVVEAKAAKIQIQPSSKGMTYTFGTNFSMLYPSEFFLALNFSAPTIGVTIEVVPPEGFDVTATNTPTRTKNIWRYDKLFMPNEHLDVRWQRVDKPHNSD